MRPSNVQNRKEKCLLVPLCSHVRGPANGEYPVRMTRGSLKQLGLLTGCLPISHNGPRMTSARPFLYHVVHHSGMGGVWYQHLPLGHSYKGTSGLGMVPSP